MAFDTDIGLASVRGARAANEDAAGARRADPVDVGAGLVAVVADGVSAGGRGAEAARSAVAMLLADFHAAPITWHPSVALDRLYAAHNRWLRAQWRQRLGLRHDDGAASLTTLTTLVLQGQSWSIAHVGDTRAWRLADGQLQLLTQDHALPHPDQRSGLTRALGLDDVLHVDHLQGEARVGDVFVLTSDGVHGVLMPQRLAEIVAADGSAQAASEALVQASLQAGSRDNASAVVVRVRGLDAAQLPEEMARLGRLSALPMLRVGDEVDGFTVTATVADNGVHRLYQARTPSGELVVLKTLHTARERDAQERAMLAHEAWLGRRLTEHDAEGLVRVRPGPASALYVVFDWHGGLTLEQLMARGGRAPVDEVVAGMRAVARALGRLHRQGVIHRDVKPANLHRGDDGRWRLIDLGAALSGREPAAVRELHAGTPSYMNPEQWDGAPADAAADVYALGVTLYHWLTGRLPYGEVEPYQTGRYRRDPVAPSRHRPDIPVWLDHLVLKSVALDRRQRFETAEELLLALDRGAARPVQAPPPTPLAARDPLAVRTFLLVVSLLFNLLLVIWLLFLPR